jgi:hypothetical protein
MELMPAEQVLLGKTFAFASKFCNEAALVMYAAHDPISQCKAIMRGDKEAAHKEPLTAISHASMCKETYSPRAKRLCFYQVVLSV